jgi:diguanylate cyclase (GGDEF)-like protein
MSLLKEARLYKKFMISVSLTIVVVVSGIYFGMAVRTRQLIDAENLVQARTLLNSILLTRKWNSDYGGVYIEKKQGVQSNPYLKDPDIQATDGRVFTKKNPALMTREISDYAVKEGRFVFRITSLKPLNPANAPDSFEAGALKMFEKGATELSRNEIIDGRAHFRYVAPLYVETSCLQCHIEEGYKEGEVRGGISVSFDIENSRSKLRFNNFMIALFALTSTAFLSGLVYFYTSKLMQRISAALRQIEQMAISDSLTGTFNRHHSMTRFGEEFEKAKREQTDLGCIMIDIDNFKAINDKYGHQTGDEVLKEIAARLKHSLRVYDILGRYGGEEFLIVLPGMNSEKTRRLAERIRIHLKESPICNLKVTGSLGSSCFQKDDSSIDDIIKRADEGLYRAKHLGRDRVE